MVYFFKTPSPKAGRSVRFASSPVKSGRRLLGSTNLKSTVGQYSRTDHTNTVTNFSFSILHQSYSTGVPTPGWCRSCSLQFSFRIENRSDFEFYCTVISTCTGSDSHKWSSGDNFFFCNQPHSGSLSPIVLHQTHLALQLLLM
jgi:hypothetical protein